MTSEALFEPKSNRHAVLHFFRRYGTLLALGLTILIFTIFAPRFLTLLNFFNISRQIAVLFILGVAETYALIDGEIDLSTAETRRGVTQIR